MVDWSDRAEDLLYDGESIDRAVEVGTTSVVITTHRVLVFRPGSGDANFEQVERPNVTGVALRVDGRHGFFQWGGWMFVLGLGSILVGVLLPVDSLFGGTTVPEGGSGASQLGVGGVFEMVRSGLALLRSLDTLLAAAGVLAVFTALALLGAYFFSRDRAIVIGVSGDADAIWISAPGTDAPEVAEELETEILPPGQTGEVDAGLVGRLLG